MDEWEALLQEQGKIEPEQLQFLLEKFIKLYVQEKKHKEMESEAKELHMNLLKNTRAFMEGMKNQIIQYQVNVKRLEDENAKLRHDLDLYRRNNRVSVEEGA